MADDPNKQRIAANAQKMAAAGASMDEIETYLQSESLRPAAQKVAAPMSAADANAEVASKAFGESSAKLFNTMDRTASWLNQTDIGKKVNSVLGAKGGAFGQAGSFMQKKADAIVVNPLDETASLNQRVNRGLAEIIGGALPMVGAAEVAGLALNPLASVTVGAGTRAAATALGATQRIASATAAAATAIPSSIAAVAAFGPEELKTPSGALAVVLPSAIAGLGNFLQTASGLSKLARDPVSPVASKDLVKAVDDFRTQFDQIVGYEPFKSTGIAPKVQLETPTTFTAKSWNPEIAKNTRIPAGEEFDYFRSEASKLWDKQKSVTDQIRKLLNTDKGAFSEQKMQQLSNLQQKLQEINDDYKQYVDPWLNKTAENQSGLMFSNNLDPSTVIKFAQNDKPNFLTPPQGKSRLVQVSEPPQFAHDITWNRDNVAPPADPRLTKGLPDTIEWEKPPSTKIPWQQQWDDRYYGIGKISSVTQKYFNNLGNTSARAESFLKDALYSISGDITGTTTPIEGMPLQQIKFALAPGEYRPFGEYLKALRTTDNTGIATNMTLADAQTRISAASPKFNQLAAEYKKTPDALADMFVKAGIWSDDVANELKQEFYVPVRAMFTDDVPYNMTAKRVGQTERLTSDPIRQTADNVRSAIHKAHENIGWKKLIEDYQSPENQAAFPDWIKPVHVPEAEVQAAAQKYVQQGYSSAAADAAAKTELMGKLDRSSGTINVYDRGQLYRYKVHPILADAKQAMGPLELDGMQQAMRMLSRPLRESVALANDLSIIRGPVMDMTRAAPSVAAAGFSWNPILDPIRSAISAAARDGIFQDAVRAGLNVSARGRPSELVQESIPFLQKLQDTPIKTIGNLPGDAIAAANDLIRPLNTGTRLAMYRAALGGGLNPTEAASWANDAMGNWTKVGSNLVARKYQATVAFGNYGKEAAKSDLQLIIKAFKNPLKVGVPVIGTAFASITLPTLAAYFSGYDDPKMEALRKADNYDFLYFKNPFSEDGYTRAKVPGWGLGPIFGGSVMALIDGMDMDARKRLANSFYNSWGVNFVPTPLQTLAGLTTGQTQPFNPNSAGPIVPYKEQSVEPFAQGNENTSQIAHGLSQVAPISPYKTDFALQKMLGPLGADILNLPLGKIDGTRNVPIFGQYLVKNKSATEGSVAFYADLNRAKEALATTKRLAMDRGPKQAEYIQANSVAAGTYQQLATVASAVSKVNEQINRIARDADMTPEEKQHTIKVYRDNLDRLFINYAEAHKGPLSKIQNP